MKLKTLYHCYIPCSHHIKQYNTNCLREQIPLATVCSCRERRITHDLLSMAR